MIIIHDECWIFPCNRWLADYEDDGKTERDLYAGEREMLGAQIVLERGKTSLLELCRLVVFFWTAALVTVLKS